MIGTIGVDTHRHLLVIACDEEMDGRLGLESLTQGLAGEYLVSHRETMVGAIADLRAGARRHLLAQVEGGRRFGDLGSFLAWFAACDLCGKCLNACPLYKGELNGLFGRPKAGRAELSLLAELVLLSQWIASCSGCGMCAETCPRGVPLMLLISALSQCIRQEMHYNAGDPQQQLPWSRR